MLTVAVGVEIDAALPDSGIENEIAHGVSALAIRGGVAALKHEPLHMDVLAARALGTVLGEELGGALTGENNDFGLQAYGQALRASGGGTRSIEQTRAAFVKDKYYETQDYATIGYNSLIGKPLV